MGTQANMDSFDSCVHTLQKPGINRTWEIPNLSLKPLSTLVRQAAGRQKHWKSWSESLQSDYWLFERGLCDCGRLWRKGKKVNGIYFQIKKEYLGNLEKQWNKSSEKPANHPWNDVLTYERKEKKLTGSVYSLVLQRKVMPDQPDSISWRGDWLCEGGIALDAIYPDFIKAFNTVSYNISI